MKNTVIVFAKIAFWVVFLCNTGCMHELVSPFSSKGNMSREQQENAIKIIGESIKLKLDFAEKKIEKGGVFSPAEYFEMIKEKCVLQDSLHCYFNAYSYQDDLQELLNQELRKGICSYEDLDRARTVSGVEHMIPKTCGSFPKIDIPVWLHDVYFSMLPFVVLLFLLWIWEGKESSILSIRSPLCFIILVLLHPIYITALVVKWWRRTSKSFVAEVEIRRRKKNIFVRLSTEERSLVTVFAKSSATFKEFISWAESLGHRKYSIGIAIIAVIISAVSIQLHAQPVSVVDNPTKSYFKIEASCYQAHLVDHDVGEFECEVQPITCEIVFLSRRIRKHDVYHFLLSSGYPECREPVPIVY